MRGSEHPSAGRCLGGCPVGPPARSPPGHGACIMGRLRRVFALTAPTNLRLHPKTIVGGLWGGEHGKLEQATRREAVGGSQRCPRAGMGAGREVCMDAPAADHGCTPNHPRGASSGMLDQTTGAAAFSCSRSRGAMPAGRDGCGGRFAWMPRLQPSGRRCSSGKGCAGTGRVAPGRELNE